jgi:hypothetical protein
MIYCEDCNWRTHEWTCRDYGQCSNPNLRNSKCFDHRQTKRERYPYCDNVNRYGECIHFEPIELNRIATNLRIIWNKWRNK